MGFLLREIEDFKKGYQFTVMDLQRQIGLRKRDIPVMRNKDAIKKPLQVRQRVIYPIMIPPIIY